MATLKDVADYANVPMLTAYEALTGSKDIDNQTGNAVTGAAEALGYQLNITIRDVAAYAGVSVTTVSYVINNNPLIKPLTRQKVRKAIHDLGYHPNITARNLKANETRMIGYAWHVAEDPVRRNPLLDLFLYELAQCGEAQGYHILTFTQSGSDDVQSYEALINTNRVDGFVLSNATYNDVRIMRLMETKVPFVVYGQSNKEWDFPYVDVDGKRGVQLAVEHLASKGHERIGLISYPKGLLYGDSRTEGFLEAMHAARLPVAESWVAYSPNTLENAYQTAQKLLTTKPRPTAIVCANDVMAFGAKRFIESAGMEVGTDVALTGYDDTPVADLIGLTSIRQPIPQIAGKAIDLLLAEVARKRPAEYQITFEPSLVVRESSANPRRR
jgi:DNA-binding LacI/PurR family transcriptional regulator